MDESVGKILKSTYIVYFDTFISVSRGVGTKVKETKVNGYQLLFPLTWSYSVKLSVSHYSTSVLKMTS